MTYATTSALHSPRSMYQHSASRTHGWKRNESAKVMASMPGVSAELAGGCYGFMIDRKNRAFFGTPCLSAPWNASPL